MPAISKRAKACRHNGTACGDCPGSNRAKELALEVAALKAEIKAVKSENEELKANRQQQEALNNRFPELLAIWRTRYEEAMDKHLNKVLMRGGDVFIPMGVHLREMKTVDTWKRKHEQEQALRKKLEGVIEKWKKNNNQLRKDYEIQEKALKKTQKLLDILRPDQPRNSNAGPSCREESPDDTVEDFSEFVPKREETASPNAVEDFGIAPKRENTTPPVALEGLEMIPKREAEKGVRVKEEEEVEELEQWYQPAVKMEVEDDFEFDTNPTEASTSTPNEILTNFAFQ